MADQSGLDERKLVAMGEPLQSVARLLDEILMTVQAKVGCEPLGFALVFFATDGNESTYVSNCSTEDMIKALRETAYNLETGDVTPRSPDGRRAH